MTFDDKFYRLEQALSNVRDLAISCGVEGLSDDVISYLVELAESAEEAGDRLRHEINQAQAAADEELLRDMEDSAIVAPDRLGLVLDIRKEADRGKVKWYRATSTKVGVCVHLTQIKEGAAPWASRVKVWQRDGLPENWKLHVLGKERHALTDEALATLLAYADRVRGFPHRPYNTGMAYHVVSGSPGLVYNHPFGRITWHGDGANREYFGYAVDMHHTEYLDVALERRRLVDAITEAQADGHPIAKLTAHGAWTRKPHDPGAAFLADVALPVAQDLGLRVDMDFKRGAGATSIGEMLDR